MKNLFLLLALVFVSAEAFSADAVLIWDRYYTNVPGNQKMSTYYETIEQINRYDYVSTDTLGFSWENRGQCRTLYPPEVFAIEDELDRDSYGYELYETKVRSRLKNGLPGTWFFHVPYGRKIAAIKIRVSKPFNGYLGACRFKIYAMDPQFGTYSGTLRSRTRSK